MGRGEWSVCQEGGREGEHAQREGGKAKGSNVYHLPAFQDIDAQNRVQKVAVDRREEEGKRRGKVPASLKISRCLGRWVMGGGCLVVCSLLATGSSHGREVDDQSAQLFNREGDKHPGPLSVFTGHSPSRPKSD